MKNFKSTARILVVLTLVLIYSDVTAEHEDQIVDGFTAENSKWQLDFESQLTAELKPANAEHHLQQLTSRPHLSGTEGAKVTAEYIRDRLAEYGLPHQIEEYTAYLSQPVSVFIELIEPLQQTIPVTEDRIEEDPFTQNVADHPGWNAYSASGEATGAVVYASYGSEEDFKQIEAKGIEIKGKIVLMRYFGTGEGTKIRNAEKHGAIGAVLYTDPKEDGYRYGEVYPKGDWRPAGSIMRRPVLPFWADGDPLSPGWASVKGAKRLNPQEIGLPKIPVLPISYRSAQQILGMLTGPLAPYSMQGELPLPYKLGPGPAKLHIKTQMKNGDGPIWNVISRIPGSEFPDQWILVGNHHDAWIYGAGDPSSGTASLLEFARGLGQLMRKGYRPKRTLILAFWDAEELLLGGSTEWLEDHKQELLDKAVACINMDSSVFNTDRPLSVNSHPLLHKLFRDASKNIRDPKTGKSLYQAWLNLQNEYRTTPSVDGWGEFFDHEKELKEPYIFESPSDDAAPFFNQLALPSSDMYYGADYGMYHSIYENFHWMKTVVDPTFEYHIAMALLQGFVSLRLANADLIPFDFENEVLYWRKAMDHLYGNEKFPARKPLIDAINSWEREARAFQLENRKALMGNRKNFSELNKKIYLATRDFYRAEGPKGAELDRNLWSGSYGILPGLAHALELKDEKVLNAESKLYLHAIQKRIDSLRAMHK